MKVAFSAPSTVPSPTWSEFRNLARKSKVDSPTPAGSQIRLRPHRRHPRPAPKPSRRDFTKRTNSWIESTPRAPSPPTHRPPKTRIPARRLHRSGYPDGYGLAFWLTRHKTWSMSTHSIRITALGIARCTRPTAAFRQIRCRQTLNVTTVVAVTSARSEMAPATHLHVKAPQIA